MSDQAPTVTRRTMLGGAAAAGAGVVLGPVAEAAARVPHRSAQASGAERVFSLWAGAIDRIVTIEAPRRFALAGVQWSGAARGVRIELRTRMRNGRWGPWGLASVTGHDADAGSKGSPVAFGEPVWVGAADLLQLRSSHPVDEVRVHFVTRAPTGRPLATSASATLAQPVLDAGPGQPPIIARSVWAQNHARPAGPASYGTIKLAFVHHTDNPNGYSRADVPALLLGIFDYHRFVRGYFDVAYNFIIDAFGGIWEARAGGIDEPVVGAHAGAYNFESTGVAVLGTFMSVVPPPAAINALERLLAWKLALHGLPSLGRVRVEVDPAGAFYTPFRPGSHPLLPRVAGHRDGDFTDCPGTAFYRRLPEIRPRIALLEGVPAVLTLVSASETVPEATPVALSGTLALRHGAPIAGAPIEIQQLRRDRATTVATATTAADGSWAATLPLTRTAVLRALHPVAPAAASNVIAVGVQPLLTLALASSAPVTVSGTVNPPKPRVKLYIYRLVNGRRRLLHSKTVRARGGAFSATVLVGAAPGSYVVVARTSEGGGTLAGASAPLPITL